MRVLKIKSFDKRIIFILELNVEIKRKNILLNILISCIIVTAAIFIEIYYVKNNLTIKNIIIKAAAAIIIGVGVEIYGAFIKSIYRKYNNFFSFKKGNYLQWILVSLINGVVFFGMGLGTFLLFLALFFLQIPIRNITQIMNGLVRQPGWLSHKSYSFSG